MTNRSLRTVRVILCFLTACLWAGAGPLRAQLPKGIGQPIPRAGSVNRPAGAWTGKASETMQDGSKVEYPLDLQFSGADDALTLAVRATAKVPGGDKTLTVSIAAGYRGTFAGTRLAMRSESIEVRIVETGEIVPSGAQSIEAELVDGVLTGRVGNDDEGWTSFTAKPVGRGDPDRTPPPAPQAGALRLTGAWAGTASERIANGGQVEYPIELTFRGDDAALQLTVNGTAKVPANGQTLTVKIVGKYAGTCRDGALAMRSESIDVRVVETGEVIPAAAQQVTGRLAGGVLTGRVGSDDEGWTTFTVRPKDGANPEPRPGPIEAPGFAGTWTGTSRERTADGSEISYPMTIVFTQDGDIVKATVSADLEYPMQGGRKTPLEYRAAFRGTVQDGKLAMRSESVRVRLPELDRTQEAAQQVLNGRIENGVFVGNVGDGGPDSSRVELRRQGNIESTPVPTPRPGGNAYQTIVLERRTLRDPGLGDIDSHTLSVPAGWQLVGGPVWTGNPDHIVDLTIGMRGRDSESLDLRADLQFGYQRVESQLGVSDDNNGQKRPDGSFARKPPRQPGEVEAEIIVPNTRPGATDVRLVAAERLPRLEEALHQALKPQLDMIEAMRAGSNSDFGGVRSDSQSWFAVERARVSYREDGVEWEEEIQCSLVGYHGSVASEGIRSEIGTWSVLNLRCARARAGDLDRRLGVLWACADSVRETPRWSAAVNEIRLAISMAKTEAMRNQTAIRRSQLDEIFKRGQEAAKARSEISDMQMASWRSTQDSLDRAHAANVDAIGERQDFRSSDGNLHTVTNHFDRAFKDSKDRIILTTDPNYRPAADPVVNQVTWEEMQRVDRFREGR
ncbi:MAG: hypothetical protein U1F36_11010 [Planctomycetota bacterium]